MPIVTLLTKIKLSHIVIVLMLGLVFTSAFLYDRLQEVKQERDRHSTNYEELLISSTAEVTTLEFSHRNEIEKYIAHTSTLQEQLDSVSIKVKNVKELHYVEHHFRDTVYVPSKITTIHKTDTLSTAKWVESTNCLKIKGIVTYRGELINLAVIDKAYNTNIVITAHWQRPQKNWFSRTFGRKEVITTVTSDCGYNKTTIIKRKR